MVAGPAPVHAAAMFAILGAAGAVDLRGAIALWRADAAVHDCRAGPGLFVEPRWHGLGVGVAIQMGVGPGAGSVSPRAALESGRAAARRLEAHAAGPANELGYSP